LLLFSPAFSLLLLVDGFYKSCGDTLTPLRLEVFSLILNTALNWLLIMQLGWGIQGAAVATVVSRLVPAVCGLIGILRGYLGVEVSLFPWQLTSSAISNVKAAADAAGMIELAAYSSVPADEEQGLSESKAVCFKESPRDVTCVTDMDLTTHADEKQGLANNETDECISQSPDEETGPVADVTTPEPKAAGKGCPVGLYDCLGRVWCMLKIGASLSLSGCVYGAVFTIMVRLAGELGEAQQAGFGAALRGLEWIAFCAGEGFLAAAMTSVGQCIGAGKFQRAMEAAIMSAGVSAVATGLLGLPFVIFPEQIAAVISNDAAIIKYTAQYLHIVGFAMATVGFEMACFGAMLGAGQAGKIVLINGTLDLVRVPAAVLCLYGVSQFWTAMAWAVGLTDVLDTFLPATTPPLSVNGTIAIDNLAFANATLLDSNAIATAGQLSPPTGTFACICWVIAGTAVVKAVVYALWLGYRVATKTYFSDSRLISS
jgi:hypothetical protein